jgi:hypothetical protein
VQRYDILRQKLLDADGIGHFFGEKEVFFEAVGHGIVKIDAFHAGFSSLWTSISLQQKSKDYNRKKQYSCLPFGRSFAIITYKETYAHPLQHFYNLKGDTSL